MEKMIPPKLIRGDQIFQAKVIWGIENFNPPDHFCLIKIDPTMENWSPYIPEAEKTDPTVENDPL